MASPRVTVALPVFNGMAYLPGALAAALGQSFGDLEVLVGDNASNDGTVAFVQETARRDPRVRLLSSPKNLGAAANFNRLIQHARGTYFFWLPHDDLLHEDHLARCVETLEQDPGLVSCAASAQSIDEQGIVLPEIRRRVSLQEQSPSKRFHRFLIEHSRCEAVLGVHRTCALRETSGVRPFRGGDGVLYGELALRGRLEQLEDVLYSRRLHPTSHLASNQSAAKATRWFRGGAELGTEESVERLLRREYLKMIDEVPLSPHERRRARHAVTHWVWRRRARVVKRWLTDRMRKSTR